MTKRFVTALLALGFGLVGCGQSSARKSALLEQRSPRNTRITKPFLATEIYANPETELKPYYEGMVEELGQAARSNKSFARIPEAQRTALTERIHALASGPMNYREFLRVAYEFSKLTSLQQKCQVSMDVPEVPQMLAFYDMAMETLVEAYPKLIIMPSFKKYSVEEFNSNPLPMFLMDLNLD